MSRSNDPIERLFQQLGENTGREGNWDLPSGNVWRNIQSSLTRRRRNRRLTWMVLLGIVTLALIGYGVLELGDAGPEKNSTEANHDMVASDVGSLEPVDSANVAAGNTGSTVGVSLQAEVKEQPVKGDAGAASKGNLHQSFDDIEAVDFTEAPGAEETHIESEITRELSLLSDIGTQDLVRTQVIVEQLATNPTYVHEERRAARRIPETVSARRHDGRWLLGAYLAPGLGARYIQVPTDRPALRRALLQREEETLININFGVSAGYRAGYRWTFGLGVEYSDFQLKSMYRRQLRYTRAGETINDQGKLETRYNVNIHTSYGRASTDVVVERSQSTPLPEHTFITFEVPVRQSLRMVRLPLYARYRLTTGRVPLYLRGGMTMQFILDNHIAINGIVLLDSRADRIRTLQNESVEGARSMTVGYQVAVGTVIPVGGGWGFSLEAATSGAADPLYRNDELRVFPVSTELRLGIQYQLK